MAPPSTRSAAMSVDQKLDLLLSEVADIKKDNKLFKDDIDIIKSELQQFKSDVNESMELCFKMVNDCTNAVKENESKITKHTDEVERLSSENIHLKRQVFNLQKSLHVAEQYSRSNCLEIRGVPEKKSEVIMDVVKSVAKVLGFELRDEMVDAVHRLSVNPNNVSAPRAIIIKFCRRIDMELMRKRARVKNGFSAANLGYESESRVFVNMSLTRDTMALWTLTRAFKEERKYQYAWITSAGKIFVRKKEGAKAVHISAKEDLDQLK